MAIAQPTTQPPCDEDGEASAGQPRAALWRRFTRPIADAGRSLLDVLLPPLCLGCGSRIVTHDALCAACWQQIAFIRAPLCDRLGLPLSGIAATHGPIISALGAAEPPVYGRARAVARFDGLMRDLVHDFKYQDNPNSRRLFARWLTDAGRDLFEGADAVVPVPLSSGRLVMRRFNQAHILGAAVAAASGIPQLNFALFRARGTRRQVGLTREQRRRNVAGAFVVPPSAIAAVSGRNLILIDDVITTGATVSAAAKVLLSAGAARVDVLALALVCEP